jgi:hypothetical protein
MQDTELFDLCNEVYKKTKWSGSDFSYYKAVNDTWEILQQHACVKHTKCIPLYTSDYILEKLPVVIDAKDDAEKAHWLHLRMVALAKDEYNFYYEGTNLDFTGKPLIVLLKLVLALVDAGELPHA